MKIPTQEQCFLLMCEMKMMDHIVVHSMQVCRVATFLAEHLTPQQNGLNHGLIRAAALLHDPLTDAAATDFERAAGS